MQNCASRGQEPYWNHGADVPASVEGSSVASSSLGRAGTATAIATGHLHRPAAPVAVSAAETAEWPSRPGQGRISCDRDRPLAHHSTRSFR